jgi:hypothetical protein
VLTASTQPVRPIAETRERQAEIGEQRGVADDHGVPLDRTNDPLACGVTKLIDGANGDVTFSGAVEDGSGNLRVETAGDGCCQRENG